MARCRRSAPSPRRSPRSRRRRPSSASLPPRSPASVRPAVSGGEGRVGALEGGPAGGVLGARACHGCDVLPDALRTRGAQVDVLALYETVAEPLSPRALAAAREADYITFTSGSTVRHFMDALGPGESISEHTRTVSIGPVTSDALREHGLQPDVQAAQPEIGALVEALLADAAAGAAAGGAAAGQPAQPRT